MNTVSVRVIFINTVSQTFLTFLPLSPTILSAWQKLSSSWTSPCLNPSNSTLLKKTHIQTGFPLDFFKMNFYWSIVDFFYFKNLASQVALEVKKKKKKPRLPLQETQKMQVQSLEEEMTTHSSFITWEIPWPEEPGGLQSKGSQGVRRDWAHMHGWTVDLQCVSFCCTTKWTSNMYTYIFFLDFLPI